jgi:hypothetical protein
LAREPNEEKKVFAGHVINNAYVFYLGDPREDDHLGDPGVDGRIILRWIFGKWDGGHELD